MFNSINTMMKPIVLAIGSYALVSLCTPEPVQAESLLRFAPVIAQPETVKLLTYNIYMRAPEKVLGWICVFCDDQGERAELIPSVLSGYDVIALQEAFSDSHRHTILTALANEYPYQTDVLGRDRVLEQDGGVVIVSKWPIERSFPVLYEDVCNGGQFHAGKFIGSLLTGGGSIFSMFNSGFLRGGGGDCLADKGVLYARINIRGMRYNIFATHADSDADDQDDQDDQSVRHQQFEIIKNQIDSMQLPLNQPVIITGDLNVDLYDQPEYESMLTTLSAFHPESSTGERGHTTVGGSAYLDYVLVSNDFLQPVMATNSVEILKVDGQDLSDHFAVLGEFIFY